MSRKGVKNDPHPPGVRRPSAGIHFGLGHNAASKISRTGWRRSRRAAEELIRHGRVEVNGERAELGCSVDPLRDRVSLDSKPVSLRSRGFLLSSISQPVA